MRTVAVKLTAHAQGYLATIGKATLATQQFASKGEAAVAKHSDSINKLSNTAGLLGAGMLAGVGFVVKSAAQFDKAMSAVRATGDDARQNFDALRKTAIDLGASTAFSATEAAKGIETMSKAGVSARDIMGGGLKGALDLAAAGNIEVGAAAEVASIAMAQFNLTGADVPHIADLIAAGAGKAQGEVGDMAAAMKQSGLVASQFGVSLEENVGTLSAFANAGLIGSDAGTSFKTMLLQLASPSDKAADLMHELGISAYDAQGQFVGIADLAEQLKNKLGPLAQAERDAALATIFGTDAIRAANVLYKEGGVGITDWTNKVNEAGYASKVARERLNNLSGDVEAFKGVLESTFIQSGSGANAAMRGLTQSATEAVRAFGNLPAPVLETGLKLTALGGISLLAVAGIGRLVTSAVDLHGTFRDLQVSSPRTARGIASVGKAAGVATGLLVGLQLAGAASNQVFGKFSVSVDDAADALLKLGDSSAAMDKLFKFTSFSADPRFVDSINGIGDAFERLGRPDFFQRIADPMNEFFEGISNTSVTTTVKIKNSFEALDKAISSLGPAEAGKAFADLRTQAEAAGVPLQDLVDLFPVYSDQVRAAAQASGVTVTSTQMLADIMSGKLPAGMSAVADSTGKLTFAQRSLDQATGLTNEELQDQIDNFTVLREGALDVGRAEVKLAEAFDALSASTKGGSNSLSKNTKEGRANREAVLNAIEAINDKITADVKEKGTTDGSSRSLERHQAQLVKDARKAGLSEKAVKEMIKQYMKTPKELKTEVKTPGMNRAIESAKELDKRIRGINNKTTRLSMQFRASAAKAMVKAFKHIPGSQASGFVNNIPTFASGGPVRGSSPNSKADNIPAMLTAGEHVLTTGDVKAAGGHQAIADWRKSLPRFARGGPVNRNITVKVSQTGLKNTFQKTGRAVGAGVDTTAEVGDDVNTALAKAAESMLTKAMEQNLGAGLAAGGRPIGRGQAALIRYGRMLGMGASTYAGHHPSRAKARDFSPVHRNRGNALAGHAWAHAKNYGIWYVIWNRRIASRTRPGAGWAPYRRSNPHTDHVHVSWYDKGGILKPGWTLAYNGTGRNERVTPAGGERPVSDYRFAGGGGNHITYGGGGDVTVVLNAPNYVGSQAELKRTFVNMFRRGDLDSVIKR